MFSAGGQAEIQKIIHIGMEMQVTVQLVVHVLRLNHVKGFRTTSAHIICVTKSIDDDVDNGHKCLSVTDCQFFKSRRASHYNCIIKF